MTDVLITRFIDNINSLNAENVNEVLDDTYTQQINFIDPVKTINGLDNLQQYFSHLYQKVHHCHFEISNCMLSNEHYSLEWIMHLQHKKLSANKTILLNGASFIRFDAEKINYHRDYYDLGALIYEQIPLLGAVVKKVRAAI